ncbi:MAG: NAD-binding protein [Armatimonadetes bacterium]|nr:NAD-binding protein [Armatimonadota bacterium]MDW8120756.1 NAD-binding protein [Armatimonadota bacterium]
MKKTIKVVILGCGRVGSTLALMLIQEGHRVTVIDKDPDAFRRLGEDFQGRTYVGQGIDVDVLREAGLEEADAFLAVTNGDNTNVMASQIAKVRFHVPKVLARIYDPLRAAVYKELGIETVSVTTLGAGMLFDRLFDRPYRPVADYLTITREVHRLYAPDMPTADQAAVRKAAGKPEYIIVAGGGKVGSQLAIALLKEGYDVLLVEKRRPRYELLREQLGDNVFFGDACEIRTMIRLGMERADVVVAVTGDDEDNLVICQVAKKWFKVPRVIARVNDPRNEENFRLLGIDQTVSATGLLMSFIEQEVPMPVVPLAALGRGGLEVVEVFLQSDSPAVGQTVRDLQLPPGSLLVAVLRNESAQAVSGDTVLLDGDQILAIAPKGSVDDLTKALTG